MVATYGSVWRSGRLDRIRGDQRSDVASADTRLPLPVLLHRVCDWSSLRSSTLGIVEARQDAYSQTIYANASTRRITTDFRIVRNSWMSIAMGSNNPSATDGV